MADRQTSPERSAAEFFSAWKTTESTSADRAGAERLKRVPWAKPLLDNLDRARESGTRWQQRAYLFETRIALSIDRLGYQAVYEYKAGEGETSIDFRVTSKPEMLIEAITIGNSQASDGVGWVKEYEQGAPTFGINFTSANPDPRRTTAGEMVRVVEKMTEKASKFPSPRLGAYHLILADIRGYCAGLVDLDDCRQIAWGPCAVREKSNVQFFEAAPVRGIFDSENSGSHPVRAQQRLHAVGFFGVEGMDQTDVLSTQGSSYHANPLLITTEHEARCMAGLLDGCVA